MSNSIIIPVVNVILAIVSIGIGIRTYMLMREAVLGRAWLFFILGSISFAVMQVAATIMRTGDAMPMDGGVSTLGIVHDVAALGIIAFFLIGSYMQFRALTEVVDMPLPE